MMNCFILKFRTQGQQQVHYSSETISDEVKLRFVFGLAYWVGYLTVVSDEELN